MLTSYTNAEVRAGARIGADGWMTVWRKKIYQSGILIHPETVPSGVLRSLASMMQCRDSAGILDKVALLAFTAACPANV